MAWYSQGIVWFLSTQSSLIVVLSVNMIAHVGPSASTHFDAVKYLRARLKSGPALPVGKCKQ